MNYLTMDFGGTLAKYSVMDEDLNVYLRDEAPAPTTTPEDYYEFVAGIFRKVEKECDVKGIALSMPGVIDAEKGVLMGSGAYRMLAGQCVTEEIEKRTGVPVTMENDGKCGVLAEVWKGNLADVDDGVVIILGTGIAGGIVQNRKILKGKDLSAGEFSYSIDEDGRRAFIEDFFAVLEAPGFQTLTEYQNGGLKSIAASYNRIRHLDDATQEKIRQLFRIFGGEVAEQLKESWPKFSLWDAFQNMRFRDARGARPGIEGDVEAEAAADPEAADAAEDAAAEADVPAEAADDQIFIGDEAAMD